jgi:TATA-binding protein-associated factor Taf7
MDELATTKPSDDQSLEPESINRVVLQSLKDLESDLRKYANKAEQAVVPVLSRLLALTIILLPVALVLDMALSAPYLYFKHKLKGWK